MKRLNLALAGSILLSLAVLQGCQNCDEPVKAAQAAFESSLAAAKDSVAGAWKTQVDSLRASYDLQIMGLQTQLDEALAKAATPAKKPSSSTSAPKKEEPKKEEPKKEEPKKEPTSAKDAMKKEDGTSQPASQPKSAKDAMKKQP